ncbi:MAG: hypothetical protein V4487_07385 [Chlamydiota bacterium]
MTVSNTSLSGLKNCATTAWSKVSYPFVVSKNFTVNKIQQASSILKTCAIAVKDQLRDGVLAYKEEFSEAGDELLEAASDARETLINQASRTKTVIYNYTVKPVLDTADALKNTTRITYISLRNGLGAAKDTVYDYTVAPVKSGAKAVKSAVVEDICPKITNTATDAVAAVYATGTEIARLEARAYLYGIARKDAFCENVVYYKNQGMVVAETVYDLGEMICEETLGAAKKTVQTARSIVAFTVLIPQKIQNNIPTPEIVVEATGEVIQGIDIIPDLIKSVIFYNVAGPWVSGAFAARFVHSHHKQAIEYISPKVETAVQIVWEKLPSKPVALQTTKALAQGSIALLDKISDPVKAGVLYYKTPLGWWAPAFLALRYGYNKRDLVLQRGKDLIAHPQTKEAATKLLQAIPTKQQMMGIATSIKHLWNARSDLTKVTLTAAGIYCIPYATGLGYSLLSNACCFMIGGHGLVVLYVGRKAAENYKDPIKKMGTQVLAQPHIAQITNELVPFVKEQVSRPCVVQGRNLNPLHLLFPAPFSSSNTPLNEINNITSQLILERRNLATTPAFNQPHLAIMPPDPNPPNPVVSPQVAAQQRVQLPPSIHLQNLLPPPEMKRNIFQEGAPPSNKKPAHRDPLLNPAPPLNLPPQPPIQQQMQPLPPLQNSIVQPLASSQIVPRNPVDMSHSLTYVPTIARLPPAQNPLPLNGIQAAPPVILNPVQAIPQAIGPQAIVQNINWKERTDSGIEALAQDLSRFATFKQLVDACGFEASKATFASAPAHPTHPLDLLQLMDAAAKPNADGSPPSLWSVFVKHYKLSITDSKWWSAGWTYLTRYATGIIPNTVDAYLREFIQRTRAELTQEDSGQNLTKFIRKLLNNTNEFLSDYNGAIEDFALGKVPLGVAPGDLDKYKERAIQRNYGSLEDLSKKFSRMFVEKYSPRVLFFKNARTKWYGKIFNYPPLTWLESLLNLVIRNEMKRTILPPTIQEGARVGIDAASPHNALFTLAMTKFFKLQCEKLRLMLAEAPKDLAPPPPLPGTEKLSTVVANLMRILDLAPHETPPALNAKIKELENGKGVIGGPIHDGIRQATEDGLHLLLHDLADPKNTEQMFAQLLELARAPFSGGVPTSNEAWKKLIEESKQEENKLKAEAHHILQIIIRDAVNKKVHGALPLEAEKIAEGNLEVQKKQAQGTFERLSGLCLRMQGKIQRSVNAPEENNIQEEINAFALLGQEYANQSQAKREAPELTLADRQAIERALNPLDEQTRVIFKKIRLLSDLQTKFSSHATIILELLQIKKSLYSIPDLLAQNPRQIRNIIVALQKSLPQIERHLPKDPPPAILIELRNLTSELANLSDVIAIDQQVLDSLYTLAPPRNPNEPIQQLGLLELLGNCKQGRPLPAGFSLTGCLEQINGLLAYFPDKNQNEATELRKQIDRIIKLPKETTFEREWMYLGELLQRIRGEHLNLKRDQFNLVQKNLEIFQNRVNHLSDTYNQFKEQNHNEMSKEIGDVSLGLMNLCKDAATAALAPQRRWTNTQFGENVGEWLGGLVGTFFGGGLLTGGTALGAKLGEYGGAMVAQTLTNNIITYGEDKILTDVEKIFDQAFKLTINNHVYHAATTRLMKTMIEENP